MLNNTGVRMIWCGSQQVVKSCRSTQSLGARADSVKELIELEPYPADYRDLH